MELRVVDKNFDVRVLSLDYAMKMAYTEKFQSETKQSDIPTAIVKIAEEFETYLKG